MIPGGRNRTRYVFICALLACGLAVPWLVSAGSGDGDALREAFESGNALYEQGDYDGAIRTYEELADTGVVNKDLFYNLGNSYYKTDDLGRAVLFYERALRLSPRDKDARENLTLVRTQLSDRQFVRSQNRIAGAMVWFHNNLNTREMLFFTSLFYVLMCLIAIACVFRDSRTVKAIYNVISVLSPGRLAGLSRSQDLLIVLIVIGCFFVTTGVSSYHKLQRDSARQEAIVLEREIPVFSSPTEDATLQFKIHEGTLVTVEQQRHRWVRIGLPGGLSGWVAADSIERI